MSEQNSSTYGTLDQEQPTTSEAPRQVQEKSTAEPAPASVLDEIVATLEKSQGEQTATWEIPDRPGFELEFSTYIPAADFKRYQASAQQGNRKTRRGRAGGDGIDQFELCLAIIREKSTRIIFQGTEVRETTGDPMTLNSPEFLAMIRRTKAWAEVTTLGEAIEEFLTAGFLVQLGDSIITEAGYAGETSPVNR